MTYKLNEISLFWCSWGTFGVILFIFSQVMKYRRMKYFSFIISIGIIFVIALFYYCCMNSGGNKGAEFVL